MGFDIGGVATLTSNGTVLSLDGTVANVMKVSASGILTRTQTPFMRGQLTGLSTPYNGGGGPLKITADVNRGNCWNNSTGYWTCPVAGYYMMTLGNIAGPSSGYFCPVKNGAAIAQNHWNHSGNWHFVTISTIANCAAGDTLHWRIESTNPATGGFYAAGGHCMYSFALMA